MTRPVRPTEKAVRRATNERLGGEIAPVDVFRPWEPVDTSGIDPDIRESTPEELTGRGDDAA